MTKISRVLKVSMLAVIMVTMAVAFVPSSQAQLDQACVTAMKASLKIEPTTPDKAFKPITGTPVIPVTVTYTAPQQAKSLTPVLVTIKAVASDPSWATVTISPSSVPVQIADDKATSEPIKAQISISLSKDAPAFKTQSIQITADAGSGTCVTAPDTATESVQIKADFYERYQARFEKTVFKTGQNSQVSIPLTVENFGNGAIQVKFAVGEGTSKSLVMALPGLQIVPSTIGGGETNKLTVNIDVKTPFKNGYENRQDQLLIDLSGNSADSSEIQLSGLQVSAVIQTQGVYVPGFEAVTMLTALLGAVFAARRLRA